MSNCEDKNKRPGVTEREFERIHSAYSELVTDPIKELISKRRLRQAPYLSRVEVDAIQRGKLRSFML